MPTLNDVTSWMQSVMRLGRGYIAGGHLKEPEQLLELYEFEGCPFCRKVREVFSELDLDYIAHESPRGSANRDKLSALGGKAQFPYLIDPNTGTSMYESEAIITYLMNTYGKGRGPGRVLAPLNTFGSALTSAVRRRGARAVAGTESRSNDAIALELWNFEASPYCRKVREALCELNLDYRVHNVAKKSVHRPALVALGGKMQVPYLVDHKNGVAMYESDEIVAYLRKTYASA